MNECTLVGYVMYLVTTVLTLEIYLPAEILVEDVYDPLDERIFLELRDGEELAHADGS